MPLGVENNVFAASAALAVVLAVCLVTFITFFWVVERVDQALLWEKYQAINALPETTTAAQWREIVFAWMRVTSSHPTWRAAGLFASISAVITAAFAYALLLRPPPPFLTAAMIGIFVFLTAFISASAAQSNRSFHVQMPGTADAAWATLATI